MFDREVDSTVSRPKTILELRFGAIYTFSQIIYYFFIIYGIILLIYKLIELISMPYISLITIYYYFLASL